MASAAKNTKFGNRCSWKMRFFGISEGWELFKRLSIPVLMSWGILGPPLASLAK
jgi:hypothetical protein